MILYKDICSCLVSDWYSVRYRVSFCFCFCFLL